MTQCQCKVQHARACVRVRLVFGTCSASPGWGWCICSALPLSCRTRARPSPSPSEPPASFPSRCGNDPDLTLDHDGGAGTRSHRPSAMFPRSSSLSSVFLWESETHTPSLSSPTPDITNTSQRFCLRERDACVNADSPSLQSLSLSWARASSALTVTLLWRWIFQTLQLFVFVWLYEQPNASLFSTKNNIRTHYKND